MGRAAVRGSREARSRRDRPRFTVKDSSICVWRLRRVRNVISRPQGRGMAKANWTAAVLITLGLQWGIVLAFAAVAFAVAGERGATSCIAGGAAVAVPNAILALSLSLKVRHGRVISAATFLVGEGLKLLMTIAALVLAIRWLSKGLAWPAFIAGVIGALKAQWLALWYTRNT